jgi:hypothetical protein
MNRLYAGVRTVALVGEFCGVPPEKIAARLDALATQAQTLVLVVVAKPPTQLEKYAFFAMNADVPHPAELQRQEEAAAGCRALEIVALCPPWSRIEHFVVIGWRQAVQVITDQRHERVVVHEPPRRLRDRILIRGAGLPGSPPAVGLSTRALAS